MGIVGVRADDRHRTLLPRHGQGAVVAQQHQRTAGHLEVEGHVLLGRDDLGLAGGLGAARVLEQAQLELEREDAAHRLVDLGLVQQALLDRVQRALEELRRRHHHVVARAYGGRGGVRVVGVDVLLPHHPADVVPVGHQRSAVAPFAAQHLVQQPPVHGDRYAVDGLVAEHEGPAALAGDPLERRQEPRAQLAAGDVGLAGVPAALSLGVAGEMLGAGQNRRRVGESVALVAADHRRGVLADEERILAERLADPAPPQVASDAQHRRERPVDAGRGDLDGGGAGDALHQCGIPRRRHA
jgi:hypothetical protein